MTTFVFPIFLRRSPAKVPQAIVGWVSVQVTAFHTIWTGTDEREENKGVNRLNNMLAKTNLAIRPVVVPRLENPTLEKTDEGFPLPGSRGIRSGKRPYLTQI